MIASEFHHCQILLVDDEQSELEAYSLLLTTMGIGRVHTENDSRNVLAAISKLQAPIVFLDLNMPFMTGQDVLKQLREHYPQVPVIIITANSEIETAVECLRLGAHDYLVKPIDLKMFSSSLRNALQINLLRNEVMSLKGISFATEAPRHQAFNRIITRNPLMLSLFAYIESIADSGMPLLILGETGSGKELIAEATHEISGCQGEYVVVDVSGLDDTLFSDALFGHVKGAYTGAENIRSGLIEKAAGGTLFLDEIGDLSELSQVKLLRLLQEGIYYPLGSDRPKQCHARIITAANKDLTSLVGQKEGIRMDLYYRLSTHLIRIPPLRERREDIPALVAYLARQAAGSMKKQTPVIDDRAMALLMSHPFWGNIRELKAYITDAVARTESGRIEEGQISERLHGATSTGSTQPFASDSLSQLFGHFPTLDELVEFAVLESLSLSENNQSQAAKMLGVSRQALNKRLKKKTI